MSDEACIWCGGRPANSLEHIAPEGLGCPPEFVLFKGVCVSCNNKNGRLDRALLTPFEPLSVLKNIPRKKGRKPTIDGFASLASGYDENGPALYLNREKYAVETPGGKRLKGTNSNDPIKNARFERMPDGTAKISFDQELRFDRKAVRGLFKIAVETVAFFEGLGAARDPALERIKHFVVKGGGDFKAIILPDRNDGYESYFAPCHSKEGCARVCGMTLLGIGFLCDFDASFNGGKMLLSEMRRQSVAGQVIPNWPRNVWEANNKHGKI